MGRLLLLEEAQEHGDEAVDRVSVLPVGGLKTLYRESKKGAKSQRMAVDDHQCRLGVHGLSLALGHEDAGAPMTIFPQDLDPELVRRLVETGGGQLAQKMGITFVELSAERSVATMPVEGNRQVIGLLHGGAHVVLAESLGSISAATCEALVLGRTLATHTITVCDEAGNRLSTVRMTNFLKDAPGD
jgi:acyl-coenzyme A thioesterase PaaI-like protein